ncbi:phosphatase 2C-like domain-containing protein, partial [Chytriomyces sp. MP71]
AIMTALVSAFTRLDEDICNGGIDVPLATDDTTTSDLIRAHLRPALAGACTLLAYVEGRDIYVACTGDSRAVVGRRSIDGVWSALDLSVDQTVKNPQEYSRLLDEHPGELETVVVKGRVLGGLMPTRAFGDARYKWPTSLSSILLPHITNRNPPRNYFTPPYVTAKPVVTHYRATPSRDLFLVLATDGLYDELSSDDVVTVLSGFLQHSHVAAAPGVAWGADALSGDAARGFAMTKDANAATCLIRNALGGANEEKMRKLLGIPAPYCRRFRDDITVQVLFFGQDIEQQEKVGLDVARLVSEAEDVVEGELPPVDLRLAGVKQHRLQAWTSYLARLERMERKEKEGAVKSKL